VQQEFATVLKKLEQDDQFQASLKRLKKEVNLKKLQFVRGATFDAYGQIRRACHPATRTDWLRHIQDWAQRPASRSIF